MSRDHQEVDELTAQFKALLPALSQARSTPDRPTTCAVCCSVCTAWLKVHFSKEEEIYLPLLDDTLTPAEAGEMFEKMEAAAGEAKRHAA